MGTLLLTTAICLLATLVNAEIKLSKEEIDCLRKEKFYHQPSDQCYSLATKGPCAEGEWFVLRAPQPTDKEDIVQAICKKDLCGERSYYWDDEKKCVTLDDKERLCGKSDTVLLANNDFGEAECMCQRSPVHVRLNFDPNQPCVQPYRQGPCKKGEIVAFASASAEAPTCSRDPCYEDARYKKATGQIPFSAALAMYNGTCYELETQGPCKTRELFQMSLAARGATCNVLTHAIFDLEKPDEPQVVNVKNPSEGAYTASMLHSLHEWKQKQHQHYRSNGEAEEEILDAENEADEYFYDGFGVPIQLAEPEN